MARTLKLFCFLAVLVTAFTFGGCGDPNTVIDQNTEIADHNWTYANLVAFPVKIDDINVPYNLYLNLRVTGDYRYSNLFVLIHQTRPDGKTLITRFEFKLANIDGEWLGKGSGNLYSFQIPFRTNYKFPLKGTYQFQIEQNMRDNPLREVSDVGLRVEKAAGASN